MDSTQLRIAENFNQESVVVFLNLHPWLWVKELKKTVIRKFREEWKLNRPWLSYNPQTGSMYCSVCQLANVLNLFTTGCNILKKENVTNHEKAKGKFYFFDEFIYI